MICRNCGNTINEGASFCLHCGAPVTAPTAAAPVYTAPTYASAPAYNTSPILVFGILALSFACTFYFSFLGIIFGAIASSKANAYLAMGGVLAGKAKTGRILGKIGLILGIVFTALCFFVLFALIMAEM